MMSCNLLLRLLNGEYHRVIFLGRFCLFVQRMILGMSLTSYTPFCMQMKKYIIKIDDHSVITMNNDCLQKANRFKYLGVITDHKLNKTQHIAHVKNKISKGDYF